MKLRALNQKVAVKDKVVLLRIDADVPIKKNTVVEGSHGRLQKAAVTIEWLRQRGARVVILAHRGRPEGKRVAAYSLGPAAKRLGQLLRMDIPLSAEITGPRLEKRVREMHSGDVLMVENTRFVSGEQKDDAELAKKWAKLGDIYVNNAFASSHRKHASVHALSKLLPAYAGLQVATEVNTLTKLTSNPKKPFVFVLGGAKIATKIDTVESMLAVGVTFCIGGALAHPFFVAKGWEIGKSLMHEGDEVLAKRLLKKYPNQIWLPEDVVVVRGLRKSATQVVKQADQIAKNEYSVDIGPQTIRRFNALTSTAKTVVWNGPLGLTEIPGLEKGTFAVTKKLGTLANVMTVAGGGDTLPVLERFNLDHKFSFISTGGGAMMTLLAQKPLPGLKALTR